MNLSPLFRHASKALQEAARREFQKTTVGQLVSEVERLSRRGVASTSHMRSLERHLNKLRSTSSIRQSLARTEVGQAANEVMRYARSGWKSTLLDEIFGDLGPIGDLIQGLLRPKGKKLAGIDRELQAASNLLKSFGYEVIPPPGKRAGLEKKTASARKFLESLGFRVTPPQTAKEEIPEVEHETGRATVDITVGARRRRFRRDDPIITGVMVPVKSSNVHSIGYIFDYSDTENGILKVRFLGTGDGNSRRGPGPLYYYGDKHSGVHPDLFVAFRKASSKGTFVWDKLRIRGTVSQHQYPYELKGIAAGYVPRAATLVGREEWFIQRRVRDRQTRTVYASGLPDELVGRLPKGMKRGVPNRGTPNRGRPNRGRP